ncbi:class I histocompatibility antigen, F10 alpha chain-like isoform X1 [Buteo buteo]|uniref:class I histocompatibility antigen, F10 alpha chain-like isoform X1 n=2 Tax=Buteo buteo TaxID=30397 RepID=UPI003EBFE144
MGLGRGLGLELGLLLGLLSGAVSELHSLRYFHVAVSEPSPGVPQFVSMGYVDGNLISRYDSETGRTVPRADWMVDNLDQQHWDGETQIGQRNQQVYRINLDTLRDRYNQSGRAHTLQHMHGCDILEDGSTRGYLQDAYDGRDFIAFDLDTMTFTAADAVAQITKRRWEKDGSEAARRKHYLKNTCIEWLRKYVSYGQAVLERKEPPMVRVSGKEARGILTLYCRAYGFYPRPIGVSWLKDGEVRDQETERGGIAPNSDGTYYTWASIEALPEEKDKYRCRVEHASLPEPGLFAWETESNLFTIILAVAFAILLTVVIAGFAFWKYKSGRKKKGCDPPSVGTYGRDRVSSLVLTAPSCSIPAAHGCFSLTGTDGGADSSAKGLTV